MQKPIRVLITGATDGIGAATAHSLAELDCELLIHGRSADKLATIHKSLLEAIPNAKLETFQADLSDFHQVIDLAEQIKGTHQQIDVLINNAGVFKLSQSKTQDGLDVRFVVNTLAPYLLTQLLLPVLSPKGRIINLSSAAQASVEPHELFSLKDFSDSAAYAKSKLAITMWSKHLAGKLVDTNQVVVAVNPASMLGSKMVKEAYGVAGGDVQRGADILVKATLSQEFATANGLYFDNDTGQFASPHPDGTDDIKCRKLTETLDEWVTNLLQSER